MNCSGGYESLFSIGDFAELAARAREHRAGFRASVRCRVDQLAAYDGGG